MAKRRALAEGVPLRSAGPDSWIWIAGALASGAAAASLWLGSARRLGNERRGYLWLAGAALAWCVAAVGQLVLGRQPSVPLTSADLAEIVALGPAVIGIVLLASPMSATGSPGAHALQLIARWPDMTARQLWGHLADAYVMASALLVICWLGLFGSVYTKSGEDPRTFLVTTARPLAGVLVASALLPVVARTGRRAIVPYLAIFVVILGESLATAVRLSGGHEPGGTGLAAKTAGYLLLGAAPWLGGRRSVAATVGNRATTVRVPAGAIVSALIAGAAALLLIASETAGGSRVAPVVVIAASGAVLALAARVLGLLRENRLALDAARVSGGRIRDLADRTSDAVLICDRDGTVRYASPAVATYGYPVAAIEGSNLADFVHPQDRAAGQRAIRRISFHTDDAANGTGVGGSGDPAVPSASRPADGAAGEFGSRSPVARFGCRVRAADGTWRHTECTVSRYQESGGHPEFLFTARDVSDHFALRQQVNHLTFHDGLTGLPNRAYLEECAEVLFSRSPGGAGLAGDGRHGANGAADGAVPDCVEVGAVFVDLDGFTAVNDSAGHAAGDLLLTQAARRLREIVPPQHTLARWGGDEFAVLVSARSGPREIVDLAEQLARCVAAAPFSVSGRDVALTASVGVALAADSLPRDLMRNADVALTRAKGSGGGHVEIFAAHMHADIVRQLEIASDLRRAVADDRLAIEYQPIVELATARMTGVEALVRWRRGDDLVPPTEFLPIAEETGLVVPIGDWVLREACKQLVRWRQAGSAGLSMSVNFSARQIGAPGFVASVLDALASSGLEAGALIIEVAEQVLAARGGELARRLSELRGHGTRIAIDDFGTGYASLEHLRKLPVDVIKIDPSFVSGLCADETLTMLTATIVKLGHDLGVTVVAEGIEQPRQLELLREMGCGCGQGHLIGRPMAAADMAIMIRAGLAGHGGPQMGNIPLSM
jgi:diguanylate cyclase (GGDEF)-like protein